jgi:hypothetical protein
MDSAIDPQRFLVLHVHPQQTSAMGGIVLFGTDPSLRHTTHGFCRTAEGISEAMLQYPRRMC